MYYKLAEILETFRFYKTRTRRKFSIKVVCERGPRHFGGKT